MSSSSLWDNIWRKLTLTEDQIEFREYQTTWLLRLCRRYHDAFTLILIKVPPLFEAFVTRNEKWVGLRVALQFLFGLFLGLMFYLVIVVDLQMDPISTNIVGVFIALFLAIGNVLSSQVRCLSLLLPLRFGTRTGRNLLMALILVYLSAGPITNITENLKESVRVILCQVFMTFSLTKTKYELMFKPLGEAFVKLRADTSETKEMVNSIEQTAGVIQKEFLDDEETNKWKEENDYVDDKANESRRSKDIDDLYRTSPDEDLSDTVVKKYSRKLKYRCENIASDTAKLCKKTFEKTQENCEKSIPNFLGFLCRLLSTVNTCNQKHLFGGTSLCYLSPYLIKPELGQKYAFLQESKNKVKNELKETAFHFKVIQIPSQAKKVANAIYDTGQTMVHEFRERKGLIETLIMVVMRCTAFAFLFVIISCFNYMANYLNDVEEDNMYVTTYFRKIDYRRYIKGKFTLLPLKSSEKRDISDVFMLYLTTSEKAELLHALISTLLLLFFSILFVSIDYFLYNVLMDIRMFGYIEYVQTGHHDLSLDIKGVGFLASMLRSLAHNFVVKRRIEKVTTNRGTAYYSPSSIAWKLEIPSIFRVIYFLLAHVMHLTISIYSSYECLPNPLEPGEYNFKLFGTFLLLFLLAWLNAYVLKRLSRYVCSIFYPKAEKKRIIFLYNQMMKKRITYLNYRLDMVKKEAEEKKFLVLRIKYPKMFGWIMYLNTGRRECVICRESEPKSGGPNRCAGINCYLYFCQQCWDFVVKRQCIGCAKHIQAKSSVPLPIQNAN